MRPQVLRFGIASRQGRLCFCFSIVLRVLMKVKSEEVLWWNVRKLFRGGGAYKNPVRLSMSDGLMETVEYARVNMWCMIDQIIADCFSWIPEHEGSSHQPAFTGSWLTISHIHIPCLPSGRTLFWSDILVTGRVLSWERWKVVSWRGGKGKEIVKWQVRRGWRVVRWLGGKGARVVRWQGGKGGRVVKLWDGRFLVSFKGGVRRVNLRFHLFGAGWVQDYLVWLQRWKDSP